MDETKDEEKDEKKGGGGEPPLGNLASEVALVASVAKAVNARQTTLQRIQNVTKKVHFDETVKRNDGPLLGEETRLVQLSPFVWGRIGWEWYFILAQTYPENPTPETQEDMRRQLYSLARLLPCQKECAPHLAEGLRISEPRVENRRALVDYLLQLRNHVAKRTGGTELTLAQLTERLAEQQQAVAAVVYYPKKDDLAKIQEVKNLSTWDKLSYEWKNLNLSGEILVAITTCTGVTLFFLIVLGISALRKKKPAEESVN